MEWKIIEQGPRAVVEVWRTDERDGLYKAYLTAAGQECLLGTLAPEGGRLYLRRVLSIDSLKRQGLWPVQGVEERLVCSFQSSGQPFHWSDPVLRRSANKLPDHQIKRVGDGFLLSFAFNPHAPFPLTPVFCFARVEKGKVFFSFHENGMPYISSARGENMKETDTKEGKYGKSDHKGVGRAGGSAGV